MAARPDLPDLPELTSARFFAALAVMLGHFNAFLQLPDSVWFLLGGYGVSFFFVLSGFILCYRYWDEFAGGVRSRPYRAYFAARVARIYPSYLLALVLITLTYLAIAHFRPAQIAFPPNAVQSWIANLLALQTFAPSYATQQNWNGPAWSISTEFGFYVACPLILALLARRARTTGALAAAFGAAIAYGALMQGALLWAVITHGWDRSFWLDLVGSRNIIWRIPEFVAGAIAARLWRAGRLAWLGRPSARNALLLAGLAAVAALNAAPWPPAESTAMYVMRQFRLDVAYMLPFAAVVLALAAGPTFLSPLLRLRALVFLGNASYGVYIYHWIGVTVVAHALAGGASLGVASIWAIAASVVAFASLSYVAYETPARRFIRAKLGG